MVPISVAYQWLGALRLLFPNAGNLKIAVGIIPGWQLAIGGKIG